MVMGLNLHPWQLTVSAATWAVVLWIYIVLQPGVVQSSQLLHDQSDNTSILQCDHYNCLDFVSIDEHACSHLTLPGNETMTSYTEAANQKSAMSANQTPPVDPKCMPLAKPSRQVEMRCANQWFVYDTGQVKVFRKGCSSRPKKEGTHCNATDLKTPPGSKVKVAMVVCSCLGNNCNRNLSWESVMNKSRPTGAADSSLKSLMPILVWVVLMTISFSIIIWIVLKYYQRCQSRHVHEPITTMMANTSREPLFGTNYTNAPLVHLQKFLASGRFGSVWTGQLETGQSVAVKVFPLMNYDSWEAEKRCYDIPLMNSRESILRLISADRVAGQDFRLIFEYHSNGSLYDYLRNHVVTWQGIVRLGSSMACGIAFLHEDEGAETNAGTGRKPRLAHRDVKSRNVLVKQDLTACIADLGLAICLDNPIPNRQHRNCLPQVGTIRYMAPEVLEGTISMSEDCLLHVDLYACALVLWELLNCCSIHGSTVNKPAHMLPFEKEVGLHPSLKDMELTVCGQNQRPEINAEFCEQFPGGDVFWRTITECWDPDPEARLTASCVQERLTDLQICHERNNCFQDFLEEPRNDSITATTNVPLVIVTPVSHFESEDVRQCMDSELDSNVDL